MLAGITPLTTTSSQLFRIYPGYILVFRIYYPTLPKIRIYPSKTNQFAGYLKILFYKGLDGNDDGEDDDDNENQIPPPLVLTVVLMVVVALADTVVLVLVVVVVAAIDPGI